MAAPLSHKHLVDLPLPLAWLYNRAYNSENVLERHENAFYLYEAFIKLAAIAGIAAYLHPAGHTAQRPDTRLDALLGNLTRPSLGHWVEMLREMSRYHATGPDVDVHPLGHVWQQLTTTQRDFPGILELYQRIKNGPDGRPAGDRRCSLLDLINALVPYRNKVRAHGGGRLESFYEEMGALLLAASNDILTFGRFDFLGPPGSRLVYLTKLQIVVGNHIELGLLNLRGWQGERLQPVMLSEEQASRLVPDCVGLLWPDSVPIRLDPLLIYRKRETEEEMLFLNAVGRQNRGIEYVNYKTGRTEEVKDEKAEAVLPLLLPRASNHGGETSAAIRSHLS